MAISIIVPTRNCYNDPGGHGRYPAVGSYSPYPCMVQYQLLPDTDAKEQTFVNQQFWSEEELFKLPASGFLLKFQNKWWKAIRVQWRLCDWEPLKPSAWHLAQLKALNEELTLKETQDEDDH